MAREIKVKIVGDASSLQRSFRSASKSANGFGSTMSNALSGATRMATAGFAVAAGAVAVGAAKAVKAASDLGESVNAVNVVFGKSAESIHEFSRVAATEAGLSMRQLNELVTPVGASLQNMGLSAEEAADASINLAKRAADMASVFNTDVNDAMTAIQAGLRGEADPLERFGVGLSAAAVNAKAMAMGLAETEKALTAQDKAQARLSLLMEQTNKVAGDFKNTSDGLANAQRIFGASLEDVSAQLGTALLPALASGMAALGDFVAKFSQAQGLRAKVEVVVEAAKDIGTAAMKIGGEVARSIGQFLGNVDWTETGNRIASGIGTAFKKGIPVLSRFAETITAGFAAAIQQADWVTIGANIGEGIKGGVKAAAKKRIQDGLVETIKSVEPVTIKVTREVARDIGQSLANTLGLTTKEEVPQAMSTVPGMIAAGADPAIAVARSAGGRIGYGLSGGLTAALSGVGASVAQTILWQINASELQIKAKYGIHSPSTVWARELGKPLGEGIVVGLDGGLALLAPTAVARIKAATDRIAAQLQSARDRFENVFSGMTDKLFRAFDAETSGHRTSAELELDAIAARRQAEGLQAALQEALETGDGAKIAKAQEDIRIAALEKQAQQERKAYEDQRATLRENLDGRLKALSAHFQKEGVTVSAALAAITKLMGQYGVSFEEAGKYIGESFMFGLQKAVGGAAAAAGGVRGAQTGGNVRPTPPIVTQVVLDGKIIAETVRREDAIYQRANGAVFAV